MTVTIYQPAQPVQIEITNPTYRAHKPWYYRITENTIVSVRFSEFMPPAISKEDSPDHAFKQGSYDITAAKFYEVYATVRQQLDDAIGLEIHELVQHTSEDDRFVEMQEDRREWAEERRQGREIY